MIIEFAHTLGAKTVAEGVETSTQAQILVTAGCDELQGYYFSKPVLADRASAIAWMPNATAHNNLLERFGS